MATTKCTMIFQAQSNVSTPEATSHRLGGWTESVYDDGSPPERVRQDFEKLCQKRSQLLGLGAAIIGQRYQQVDPSGPSNTTSKQFPGYAELPQDCPQASLLCKVPGIGVRNIRNMILRGIPDAIIKEGEYSPSDRFDRALRAFFNEMADYQFRAKDLSLTQYAIDHITDAGVVHTEVNNPLASGDYVRVLRTNNADGRQVGGRFRVTANNSTNQINLAGWTLGATTGGKVVKDAVVYPVVDYRNIAVSRIVQRKVGRGFFQYRGRASKSH